MSSSNQKNDWCWVPGGIRRWCDGVIEASTRALRDSQTRKGPRVGWGICLGLEFFRLRDSTDFETKLPQFQNKSEKTLGLRGNSPSLLESPSVPSSDLNPAQQSQSAEHWCVQQCAHKSSRPSSPTIYICKIKWINKIQ